MKKLLAAGLVASVAAIMAFGLVGSGAWFSDSVAVPVTAASGRVDIDLAGGTSSTPFSLTNVVPGVFGNTKQLNIYNTGNSTVPVKIRIRSANPSPANQLWNDLVIKIQNQFCGGADRGSPTEANVNGLNFVPTAANQRWFPLGVNFTECYVVSFKLSDLSTAQNLATNFDLVVDATQVENPGW